MGDCLTKGGIFAQFGHAKHIYRSLAELPDDTINMNPATNYPDFLYLLQDPREALILTLKREVGVLQNENEHLRSALHVYSESTNGDAAAGWSISNIYSFYSGARRRR